VSLLLLLISTLPSIPPPPSKKIVVLFPLTSSTRVLAEASEAASREEEEEEVDVDNVAAAAGSLFFATSDVARYLNGGLLASVRASTEAPATRKASLARGRRRGAARMAVSLARAIDLALFFYFLFFLEIEEMNFFLLFYKKSETYFSLFSPTATSVSKPRFFFGRNSQVMPPRHAPRYGDVIAAGNEGGGYGGARLQAHPRGEVAAPTAARVGAFVQGLLSARGACARASDVARLFRVIEGRHATGENECFLLLR